ncbi:MAG: Rne/Rng family ribonuclease [Pseudomonadota bacterium]
MTHKILINAVDPEECRIATVNNGHLEDFSIETIAREVTRGNIYKGIVVNVEQSLQASFINYGGNRHGFLQWQEIHSDYYQDNILSDSHQRPAIQTAIKPGQELVVQVTKDEASNKGAMLTTFISLPGRYLVLMPGDTTRGISRKIEDQEERHRLKELIESLKIPEGFGIIARTAGKEENKTSYAKDLQYLLRLWKTINKLSISQPAPSLLYKERHIAIRLLRDRFTNSVKEIIADNESVFQEVNDFMKIIEPRQSKLVKQYNDPTPIFTKYKIEDQIASIFARAVTLKSGGSIVLDQTEAMVAIDVNSGKTKSEESLESTAYKTNCEAADEIARQLKLRDLGGLIVIDFIDMRDRRHQSGVEKRLKAAFKEDKAKISIGSISKFGMLEMSRQRLSPSLEYSTFVKCQHCQGKGMIPSVETLALTFLRKLRSLATKGGERTIQGRVPPDVAGYLLNKKRKDLYDIEQRHNLTLIIEGDDTLAPGKDRIINQCSPGNLP